MKLEFNLDDKSNGFFFFKFSLGWLIVSFILDLYVSGLNGNPIHAVQFSSRNVTFLVSSTHEFEVMIIFLQDAGLNGNPVHGVQLSSHNITFWFSFHS